MKTSTLILFISAAFLVTSIRSDSCSQAYEFADVTMSSLKTNFFNNRFESMYEDFGNIMNSAEMIQESCPEDTDFDIEANQLPSCSLAYSALSDILEDLGLENESEMVPVLSQIISLVPTIEGNFCVEEWEVATEENQKDMMDGFWYNDDSSDDYTYDNTDDLIVEDEEEEDTGDEIYGNSDDEDNMESYEPEAEEKVITIDWSVVQQDDDSDDETEEEEDDLLEDGEDTIMVFVSMPEIVGEETIVYAEVEDQYEADIFVESEDCEPMVFEAMPEDMKEEEDEDMVMVFVQMTNMQNTEYEIGEEAVSVDASMNEELFLEDQDEDNSVFVFVNIDTDAGIDQVVDAMFADDDGDVEMSLGELDLHQYWGDDEEEESDYDY